MASKRSMKKLILMTFSGTWNEWNEKCYRVLKVGIKV